MHESHMAAALEHNEFPLLVHADIRHDQIRGLFVLRMDQRFLQCMGEFLGKRDKILFPRKICHDLLLAGTVLIELTKLGVLACEGLFDVPEQELPDALVQSQFLIRIDGHAGNQVQNMQHRFFNHDQGATSFSALARISCKRATKCVLSFSSNSSSSVESKS